MRNGEPIARHKPTYAVRGEKSVRSATFSPRRCSCDPTALALDSRPTSRRPEQGRPLAMPPVVSACDRQQWTRGARMDADHADGREILERLPRCGVDDLKGRPPAAPLGVAKELVEARTVGAIADN